MAGASQAFEEDELEIVGVEDLEVLVRRLEDLREVVPQEGEFQVGGDADRFGEPMAHELFDDAIGHDDRDRLERVASLMRGDCLGQRRDQVFESI